jgi:hypothetical protein
MTLDQLREGRREFPWRDILEELEPANTSCPSTSGSSRSVRFTRSLPGVRSHHRNAERRQILYERCELVRKRMQEWLYSRGVRVGQGRELIVEEQRGSR